MANRFEFEVCALDRFTQTFKNLNDKASKATRPLEATGRQFKALGKELHIDKITRGLGKMSQVSASVASNLGLAAGPLGSMFGIGTLGGIAGAAAGVASLTSRFADLGFNAGRSASLMGVGTRDLQRFQGAAKLTGISTEVATQSLDGFGKALQDAVYRNNPEITGTLHALGVQIKRNKDGTIDAVGTLEDYSRAVSRIADPKAQRAATDPFGMTQMLPLIRQGPEAIKRLADEAEKLGLVIDGSGIKKADKFTESLNRLQAATDGAGLAVGDMMSGPAAKAMDALTRGIVGGLPQKGSGGPKYISPEDLRQAKRLLLGPSAAGGGRGLVTPAWVAPSNLASPIAMPPGMVDITLNTESRGRRYDKNGNLLTSPAGAQGEMQVMPKTNKDPGFGVTPAKDDTPDELARVGRDYLGAMFRRYNDPAKAWAAYNAGPGALDNRLKTRGDDWLAGMPAETQNYVAKNMRALVGMGGGGANGAGGAAAAAQPTQQQPVKVEVSFTNAPAGTSATAKDSGNTFLPTRVSYSMPTEGPL